MSSKTVFLSENDLVIALKDHNKIALKVLYDTYGSALYGLICRMLKEGGTEQVLHDVFVKIWNNIDEYDSNQGRLFTWMFNITRKHALDTLRKKNLQNIISGRLYQRISRHPKAVADTYIFNTFHPELNIVVDMLLFKGYTLQETADKLGITVETVQKRIRQAIVALRKNCNV